MLAKRSIYSTIGLVFIILVVTVVFIHSPKNAVETKCQNLSCPPERPPLIKEKIVEKIVYVDKAPLNPLTKAVHRDMHYPLMLYEGFDDTTESAILIPHDKGAANIVFFVWCGAERFFQFKHMLSVLSAIKIQQPLKVILYHWPGKPPKEDLYNNWLTELRNTFYNFETTKLPSDIKEPTSCSDITQLAPVLAHLLQDHGGIYMRENVLLKEALNSLRPFNMVHLKPNGIPGVVIGRDMTIEDIKHPAKTKSCIIYKELNTMSQESCISMDFTDMYPKDIMTNDDSFSEFCRLLFYGSVEPKQPHYDLSDPIPNIGHFYLLGENTVNFFIYLSIVSMVNVLKVDMVYVHGDIEPNGNYWIRLKDTGKVVFVYCPPVQQVFGNKIDPADKFHGKDILSVYFLYLYGGVFIDWDAVFTRPLDDAVRGYDAVLGFDWFVPPEAPTFPEVINPGILAAKRHSVFIAMWLKKYKDFGKGGFYYTGLLVPYKLYEHYPETVKLDDKFQAICWMNTCHPPWMSGYQKKDFHSEFDWQTVYSVHFTYPDPPEFYNEGNLKNATTMIGHIGQRAMGWY